MDRKTVLTKTAKGLMEVTGKTSLLSRDQRNLLTHVDGKATVGDLQLKVRRMSEAKLHAALAKLIRGGFVREFVSAPHSVSPPSQLATRHDLDFSNLISEDHAGEAAMQAAEAAEIARAMQAKAAAGSTKSAADGPKSPAPDPVRDAVARAKREAEEGARREAEAQARREAEEQARREAEEKARREAEERAKREAEEKARREAEAKHKAQEQARREAEAKAKREAEEKARREAEEKARREAEEKAKREAEEKARREAEAKRKAEEQARREAEAKAKREAEEKARREAEEKARREAEEKAQREAEEKARREAEAKRKAEEQARREAEAKAKREAEEKARREAEEQARREAEEKARQAAEEKARREAEIKAKREAEAQRKAEEKARREAEARERAEAKARAAAQAAEIARLEAEAKAQRRAAERAEKARRKWAVKASEERAEQMRRAEEEQQAREAEQEAKRRQLEEERMRARAEAERAASERREQRAREKAEADARAAARKREREREFAEVAARLRRIRDGKPGRVRKWLLGALIVLLAGGALLAPYWPVNPAPYEQLARERLGVPVTIAKASFVWTPWPAMEFTQVSIGPQGEARIGKVLAVPALWSVLSDTPVLRQLDLLQVNVKPEALAPLLQAKLDAEIPTLPYIGLSDVRLDSPGATLPPLRGRIDLRGGKTPGAVWLEDHAAKLSLQLVPLGGGSGSFELQLADAQPMLGIPLTDTLAKGRLTATQADVNSFDGRLYDGVLKGQGVLTWSPLSFKGTLEATSLTTVKFAPVLEGRLSGKGSFDMAADRFDELFNQPTVEGSFDVVQGVVHGLDLPRSLQAGEVAGGQTPFEELSGQLRLENGNLRLNGMRLRAGIMAANGSAELTGGKQLDGRIAAQLRIPAGYVRANFAIGGTPQALAVKR